MRNAQGGRTALCTLGAKPEALSWPPRPYMCHHPHQSLYASPFSHHSVPPQALAFWHFLSLPCVWLLILETLVTPSVTSLTHFLFTLCSVSSGVEVFPGRFQWDFLVGTDPANTVTLDSDCGAGNCRDQRGQGCAGQWYGSLEEGREPVCRGEDLTFL